MLQLNCLGHVRPTWCAHPIQVPFQKAPPSSPGALPSLFNHLFRQKHSYTSRAKHWGWLFKLCIFVRCVCADLQLGVTVCSLMPRTVVLAQTRWAYVSICHWIYPSVKFLLGCLTFVRWSAWRFNTEVWGLNRFCLKDVLYKFLTTSRGLSQVAFVPSSSCRHCVDLVRRNWGGSCDVRSHSLLPLCHSQVGLSLLDTAEYTRVVIGR